MLDVLYRRRLERDLDAWQERGLVTPEAAEEMLASIGQEARPRTAIILGFLGAILIAFSAIAFVAANWADMARPFRLGLLVAGMAACYGIAALMSLARHPWFADAAIFAGSALFGASIMLVAQSYHISGDYPDALLMWGVGAFIAALLGPSRASLLLALVVLSLWSWYEVVDYGWMVHWPYVVAVVLIGVVAGAWHWSSGIHLSVLALVGWIVVSVLNSAYENDWSAASSVCVGCGAALVFFALGRFLSAHVHWTKASAFGPVFGIYGLIGFLAMLILLQFAIFDSGIPDLEIDRPPLMVAGVLIALAGLLLAITRAGLRSILLDGAVPLAMGIAAIGLSLAAARNEAFAESLGMQILLGVLVMVAGVWTVAFGNRVGSRAAATFGLIAFAAEVLYLYFVTFGTLLDTAVFFLTGGILMIALAAILVRLQRRLTPADGGARAAGGARA
ncbi:DUF2157 domain-containing protein [Microbaculum marinum]|uniref:DUF2157 domain-containing protein n=1 Tax=Microbaculum marinum TaxID=1764581 RepID=A0AAW9S2Y7_9HYPH